MLQRDIRGTPLYMEAESLYSRFRHPGSGLIADATEVTAHGSRAAFSGTLVDSMERGGATRICLVDLPTGDTRLLTFGPNSDRLPKFSPDGQQIAFISDRRRMGDFQLHLIDLASGACRATPSVPGWVEYLHWSPNGRRILLGVAGHGADVAGTQGAASSQTAEELPDWMPRVDSGHESFRWRRAWLFDLDANQVRQLNCAGANVWEAVWCGNDAIAAVITPAPGEGDWYTARLYLIDTTSDEARELFAPAAQLGCLAASATGRQLAFVEAVCSDRWIVAGDLRLIDVSTGNVERISTHCIDVTYAEWRSERHLLLAGHRGFETVLALYDLDAGQLQELWRSEEITTGGYYTSVSGFGSPGDCALIGEGFHRAPELAVICGGKYRSVKSFDHGATEALGVLAAVDVVDWRAPDGLEIHGLLLKPHGRAPYPLLMVVHGGPVWHYRPHWLGRRGAAILMLLKRGYAIFLPNPRGSTGRGQAFVRAVYGEIGRLDTYDFLSGLDHLVTEGIVDPARIGVTGGSYGGYMTAWLITQDTRFAAAVVMSPVTNWVTQHLVSNIPDFDAQILKDHYANLGGNYYTRSPILYASRAQTPTLTTCGVLDRCTPPEEAVQFHNALLENGIKSVLVTYPQEGHGVRQWPAAIDYAARLVGWFEEHMGGAAAEPDQARSSRAQSAFSRARQPAPPARLRKT